jgi:hypothetical protein
VEYLELRFSPASLGSPFSCEVVKNLVEISMSDSLFFSTSWPSRRLRILILLLMARIDCRDDGFDGGIPLDLRRRTKGRLVSLEDESRPRKKL